MTATHRRRRGTGHELREVVIRVAADLLAQLGDADSLTMRAVAAAAGVTAPSVYRHFPDKEALLRVVIAERFAEFTEQLENAAVSAAGDPVARLEAIARAYVRSGLEQPGHYRVLFSAMNAGPAGLGSSRALRIPARPPTRCWSTRSARACRPPTAVRHSCWPPSCGLPCTAPSTCASPNPTCHGPSPMR